MSETERIGLLIAKLRKERKLSQRQFAERVGMTQTEISRIEVGRHAARLESLAKIAKGLGMELGFINSL